MNRTHPRHVVLAALLAFLAAGVYSGPARCCDADGLGTAKSVNTPMPATVTPAAPQMAVPAPDPRPAPRAEISTAQSAAVGGGAAPSDDAGSNLGEGVGASGSAHRRGLRWQSFLPGVIK